MDYTFPEDESWEDRIQRIMNEKKRQDLEEQYGVPCDVDSSMSPYEEAEFLNYIEEFERQFKDAKTVLLRTYLGDPHVRPLDEIPQHDLADALDSVLEMMADQGVYLDFLCDVEDAEAYRFIVDELFDEEIDDIRVPGMNQHFIYEEFHPNDDYDVKMWAEDFVSSLLFHHRQGVEMAIAEEGLYNAKGQLISQRRFMAQVDAFMARNPIVIKKKIEALSSQVEGDEAIVDLSISYTTVNVNPFDMVDITARSTFQLRRSPYGGWDVVQYQMPGWDGLELYEAPSD